jgi:tRNA(Ile)-lysidine synthase
VEDASNSDVELDRNFLRHRVLPLIAERYPSYRTTLARASRHFAESAQVLDELAAADARLTAHGLGIAPLLKLSAARAKNVLRYFIAQNGVVMPNAARLDECVRQLRGRRAARIVVELGTHELRRHGGELRVVVKSPALARGFRRAWRGEARLALPELGGVLALARCRGRGISLGKLTARPVSVRLRVGGERLRPHAQRPRRSLKNLLQEAHVPPWQREQLPLLYSGSTLVYVPGIGIDAAYCARPGETAVAPRWISGRHRKRR